MLRRLLRRCLNRPKLHSLHIANRRNKEKYSPSPESSTLAVVIPPRVKPRTAASGSDPIAVSPSSKFSPPASSRSDHSLSLWGSMMIPRIHPSAGMDQCCIWRVPVSRLDKWFLAARFDQKVLAAGLDKLFVALCLLIPHCNYVILQLAAGLDQLFGFIDLRTFY